MQKRGPRRDPGPLLCVVQMSALGWERNVRLEPFADKDDLSRGACGLTPRRGCRSNVFHVRLNRREERHVSRGIKAEGRRVIASPPGWRLGDVVASIRGFAEVARINCAEHRSVASPRSGNHAACEADVRLVRKADIRAAWNACRDRALARHWYRAPSRLTAAQRPGHRQPLPGLTLASVVTSTNDAFFIFTPRPAARHPHIPDLIRDLMAKRSSGRARG